VYGESEGLHERDLCCFLDSTPHAMHSERGRVLFVDDDDTILRVVSSGLSSSGFEVTAAQTASQALAVIESRTPEALLVDINIPGNESLELVHLLSREQPLLQVVIFTGYPTLDTAVEAVRLGVVDYITKPHRIAALGDTLDIAVRRARVLRSLQEVESLGRELSRRLGSLKQVIAQGRGAAIAGEPEQPSVTDPLRNLPPGDRLKLSPREREVLAELAQGQPPQRIAKKLHLSTNTVRNHLKSIFLKLDVNSQVALLGKLAATQRSD
jgi:DNA-binding NarL/FixJ family response regulator